MCVCARTCTYVHACVCVGACEHVSVCALMCVCVGGGGGGESLNIAYSMILVRGPSILLIARF